ncbi:hypothetical protein FQA39_LY10743 [Lamprigera yunnana]|nr:hypothetical protein FQA39_LY10743 [Lamprigera yunnana]
MSYIYSAVMDCLVVPLQEKLEDWKKTVLNLDKEHAKDYKRARSELKKRSTDTLRLQKKVRKGASGDLQKRLEYGLQDVTERRQLLEETEKQAVRAALIEERSRYCTFVGFLKPVVDEEVAMLTELSHLQEVVAQLDKNTTDPQTLPPASEQVIADLKSSDSGWSFQTPPSSPSSLGSRKSSMCSISSLNSSSSGSSKSHHSPSHPHWQHSLSQSVVRNGIVRLTSVSSRDSGFTSQDTLYPRPPSSLSVAQVSNMSENSSNSSTPCTPFTSASIPTTTATWPNLQETIQFERAATAIMTDRPHTISSAYEKGHLRPPLTVYTFQAPDQSLSQPVSPVTGVIPTTDNLSVVGSQTIPLSMKSTQSKPPLPTRCSSLERSSGPNVPAKTVKSGVRVLPPGNVEHKLMKPTPLPAHIARDIPQPTYVNMHELASMAACKAQDSNLPPPPADFITPLPTEKVANEGEKDGSTSESSLESSSGYGSQTTFPVEDIAQIEDMSVSNLETAGKYCTLPRNGDHMNAIRRRPLSMTAMYSSGTIRSTLLRRGSAQTLKPLPPIRRTSSITNTNRSLTPVNSDENLPPPPAFLLEASSANKNHLSVNVAETVKALTELKHTPASPSSIRRMSSTSQISTMPQVLPQSPILSTFQSPGQPKPSYVSQSSGVIYAHPSQILSGSPSEIRRVNSARSQSAERKSNDGPGGVGSSFIAALSAKLAPSLSPRTSRRHSEDLPLMSQNITAQLKLSQRSPGQNFLDSLNAKLAQQHMTNNMQQPQLKALKIRQIINSRAQPDPKLCHESLMDQIKRGATLKRAKVVNDRSAPKIY